MNKKPTMVEWCSGVWFVIGVIILVITIRAGFGRGYGFRWDGQWHYLRLGGTSQEREK